MTSDAVWRVGFRDDTRARIHVTGRAIRLSQEEWDELVGQLEDLDWIGLLKVAWPGGLPIHKDGAVERLRPEGTEKDTRLLLLDA